MTSVLGLVFTSLSFFLAFNYVGQPSIDVPAMPDVANPVDFDHPAGIHASVRTKSRRYLNSVRRRSYLTVAKANLNQGRTNSIATSMCLIRGPGHRRRIRTGSAKFTWLESSCVLFSNLRKHVNRPNTPISQTSQHATR